MALSYLTYVFMTIVKKMKSVSTQYGPAEVTYVVLTNVVQGHLARKDEHGNPIVATSIHGRIFTHSKLLSDKCVLFSSE
uniref:Uncharacterized protein n=1 Tax=Leersia perrieri TaxID=77586 RepID=A0A0D9XPF3_9ORYZ